MAEAGSGERRGGEVLRTWVPWTLLAHEAPRLSLGAAGKLASIPFCKILDFSGNSHMPRRRSGQFWERRGG